MKKLVTTLVACNFCLGFSVFAADPAEVRVMSTMEKRDAGIVVTGDPRFPNKLPSNKVENNQSKKTMNMTLNDDEKSKKATNKS